MTELIFFDIDGTLRDERRGIPESAKRAIELCRKQNIKIVICTGRNPGAIPEDVCVLQPDGWITGGGCQICYKSNRLKTEYFQTSEMKAVVQLIKKWRLGAAFETLENIYMNDRAAQFYKADFEEKLKGLPLEEKEKLIRANKISYMDNFGDFRADAEPAHKLCFMGNEKSIAAVKAYVGNRAAAVIDGPWRDCHYLELTPPGCHKGTAVRWLCRQLDIPKKNTMAFGDGSNDIEMLNAVGVAVAMGGASPLLLPWADSVCETPFEGGIYRELVRREIIGCV